MSYRERLDAFPTQLVLTIVWATVGTAVSLWLRNSILWIGLISIYAIVATHFSAHLAWRAKREASKSVDEQPADQLEAAHRVE